MNKGELVEAIAQKTSGIATQKVINAVLSAAIDTIIDSVADGDKVTLVGFGTFEARDRVAREGRNPATGEPHIIPACTKPCFAAGKTFKERVNS